jgi:hypothetical protein
MEISKNQEDKAMKPSFLRLVMLAMLLMPLAACGSLINPKPMNMTAGMVDGAPMGTSGFRYGWKDGCESGLAAYGPMHYKVTHGYKYDTAMLSDNEYHGAWEMGFRHCRWYVAQWTS